MFLTNPTTLRRIATTAVSQTTPRIVLTLSRGVSSSSSRTCPKCGTSLPTRLPSCPNCWHIQDVSPEEKLHDILDVPKEPNPFTVDTKLLRRNFLRAQQIVHPDVWATKGERERILAERLSSKVNEAYKALQEPLPRAHYLLESEGLGIKEEEPPLEDTEALMEVMETLEEIHDTHDSETLHAIKDGNDRRTSGTIDELEKAFGETDFQKARSELIRLIYWDRINRSLKDKLHRLG